MSYRFDWYPFHGLIRSITEFNQQIKSSSHRETVGLETSNKSWSCRIFDLLFAKSIIKLQTMIVLAENTIMKFPRYK